MADRSALAAAVRVESFREPLPAIRRVLADADQALLGVAFVQQRGVNLVRRLLEAVPDVRLVATTVFGSTTVDGLSAAGEYGARLRVLNPARGTFHPKLYVARRGERISAAVGSANLTSGLIANVEAVIVLDAPVGAEPVRGSSPSRGGRTRMASTGLRNGCRPRPRCCIPNCWR